MLILSAQSIEEIHEIRTRKCFNLKNDFQSLFIQVFTNNRTSFAYRSDVQCSAGGWIHHLPPNESQDRVPIDADILW